MQPVKDLIFLMQLRLGCIANTKLLTFNLLVNKPAGYLHFLFWKHVRVEFFFIYLKGKPGTTCNLK